MKRSLLDPFLREGWSGNTKNTRQDASSHTQGVARYFHLTEMAAGTQ